jgi:hypothetical protein
MLSTLSVHRMKKSFPCHVTVRLGCGILLCFAEYLLCPVRNSVIRGVHKGVMIMFVSPQETVSVLGSCGVLRHVGYQSSGRMLFLSSEWNFRHEDGAAYSSRTVFVKTFLLAFPFWLRKIVKASHILADVNIVCPDDRIQN